ncbi:MAG: ParA family protein [Planktomarina sp.]|nr:ParA family protein [Planktomarina sp.]MDT2073563.1 ParA family protein [Planktomarina sp.]MDT2077606.1 ParA family protein [Planktomarina sp.]HAJ84200.1 chromosome partitioning protein ParA [Paracoccaceae bacterium]
MSSVQQGKPKIIAIANQKGGVGKTTTTLNLAAAFAEVGHRVLIMDLDPQGNASTGLGSGADGREFTTYDVLVGEILEDRFVIKTDVENLFLVPSTTDLSSADIELANTKNRSHLLRTVLTNSDLSQYDYILFDCPPSLNVLTVNALIAADALIIPLQSEFFALEGLSQLLMSVREVRSLGNPGLRIEGVVLTMFDGRNRLSLQVEEDARENLGELVFKTVIPRNVRISEAPSFSMPVLSYDSRSKGAKAYRALAQEILARRTQSS